MPRAFRRLGLRRQPAVGGRLQVGVASAADPDALGRPRDGLVLPEAGPEPNQGEGVPGKDGNQIADCPLDFVECS